MRKETVQDRIQKAEEKIIKKQGTIQKKMNLISKKEAQIRKIGLEPAEALEIGWTSDPDESKAFDLASDIEMLEDDLGRLRKEVAELQSKLEGYKADLQSIIEKENSRDVEVILQFLQNWKDKNIQFYKERFQDYLKESKIRRAENSEYCEKWNRRFYYNLTKDQIKILEKEESKAKKAFREKWGWIEAYTMWTPNGTELDLEKLQNHLDQEANRKYDFIIERTNAIVGQITDASALKIGNKGDLNGIIKGTKGTAKVETIGAGGYNIQCFHFRTLINKF